MKEETADDDEDEDEDGRVPLRFGETLKTERMRGLTAFLSPIRSEKME